MPLITWDDNQLSVGIKIIDEQHKQLVNLINQLSTAINNQKNSEACENIFQQLMAR